MVEERTAKTRQRRKSELLIKGRIRDAAYARHVFPVHIETSSYFSFEGNALARIYVSRDASAARHFVDCFCKQGSWPHGQRLTHECGNRG